MLRQLRWQIALAVVGLAAIGLLVVLFAHRGFTDVPSRGGEMIEAVVGYPTVVNPLFAANDVELDIAGLVFCGLMRPDPDRQMQPDLAAKWAVSADGLTYTFVLRPDALFHDGHPVTADDVIFTANMAAAIARDSSLAVSASPYVRPWEHVTAANGDGNTVVLRLPEPYAPFLDATALGILPQHLLADVPPSDLANHRFSTLEPVGCGPYRVGQPGGLDDTHARLVRFDGHWNATASQPYLDSVVLRFYPTVEAAVVDLGKRDVQVMGGVPAGIVPDLGDVAREYAAVQPGMGLVYLNNGSVLFSERALRQALSLTVDRWAISSAPDLLNGQGQASTSPIAAGSWAYAGEHDSTTVDVAGASRLLDESGWIDSDGDGVRDRDGKPLRFRLGTSSEPTMVAIAQKIAAGWKAIGVDPQVEELDQPATVRVLGERSFDAMLFSWELPQYEPDPYPLWHSSQAGQGQNYADFRNEEVDRVLVELRRLAPSGENLSARVELYRSFQQLFGEEVPSIVLYHPVYSYVVVDENLGGVQLPGLIVRRSDRFSTLSEWFVQTARVFQEDRR